LIILKRAGPNLRKKILLALKPLTTGSKNIYRRRTKLVQSKDKNSPSSTILDIIDAAGIFDYLFNDDEDEEEYVVETVPRRKVPPRQRPKSASQSRKQKA
jgi:hypothetical protein